MPVPLAQSTEFSFSHLTNYHFYGLLYFQSLRSREARLSRQIHDLKIAGSNPASATKRIWRWVTISYLTIQRDSFPLVVCKTIVFENKRAVDERFKSLESHQYYRFYSFFSLKTVALLWGLMFQGGDVLLQGLWVGFDSLSFHQILTKATKCISSPNRNQIASPNGPICVFYRV